MATPTLCKTISTASAEIAPLGTATSPLPLPSAPSSSRSTPCTASSSEQFGAAAGAVTFTRMRSGDCVISIPTRSVLCSCLLSPLCLASSPRLHSSLCFLASSSFRLAGKKNESKIFRARPPQDAARERAAGLGSASQTASDLDQILPTHRTKPRRPRDFQGWDDNLHLCTAARFVPGCACQIFWAVGNWSARRFIQLSTASASTHQAGASRAPLPPATPLARRAPSCRATALAVQ